MSRRTGRTHEMLQYVLGQARSGKNVYVICASQARVQQTFGLIKDLAKDWDILRTPFAMQIKGGGNIVVKSMDAQNVWYDFPGTFGMLGAKQDALFCPDHYCFVVLAARLRQAEQKWQRLYHLGSEPDDDNG